MRIAGSQIIWERDRSRQNQTDVEGETETRRTETWGALHPPTGALLTSWKSACPAAGAGCRGGWGAGGRSKHTASNPAHAMARRLARLRVAVPRPPRLAGGGARAHWLKRGPAPTWPRFPCLEGASKRGGVRSHPWGYWQRQPARSSTGPGAPRKSGVGSQSPKCRSHNRSNPQARHLWASVSNRRPPRLPKGL